MGIFDNEKIKVNISGKEYLDLKKYHDSKPSLFDPRQIAGLLIILFTVILGILAYSLIDDLFNDPIITSKDKFLTSIGSIQDLTWNNILKIFFITHIEIIGIVLILIGVAWVFHGFGFIIIKR